MPNFSHRNISLLLLLGLVVFYVCEDASAALGPKSFAVKNNDVHYDMVVHIDPIEGTLHGKTRAVVVLPPGHFQQLPIVALVQLSPLCVSDP